MVPRVPRLGILCARVRFHMDLPFLDKKRSVGGCDGGYPRSGGPCPDSGRTRVSQRVTTMRIK